MAYSVFRYEAGLCFLFIKKHCCAKCGGLLRRTVKTLSVSSDSKLGHELIANAMASEIYPSDSNISLSTFVFFCEKCQTGYTVKQMKEYRI